MTEWVHVATLQDVKEGQPYLVALEDCDITLYRVAQEIFATNDLCSHAEASLSEGQLEGYVIQCPRHGGAFDVRSGKAVRMPAVRPVATYAVRLENDNIYVAVQD